MNDQQLHDAYFEAMRELDGFATTYSGLYPKVPLEREDPHVRRLLEAIAFFSARTHMVSRRHLIRSRQRLFAQYFNYLLTPLPSIGVVQGVPTGRLAEVAKLPRHSLVALETDDGTEALYRTLHDLEIRPLVLDKLKVILRGGTGFRLLAQFKARFPQSHYPENLQLRVNHLNDYFASLKLFRTLQKHTENISIFYDAVPDADAKGQPCNFRFGPARDAVASAQVEYGHPLARVGMFFHYPEQELYLHLEPAANRTMWRRFTICFDLDRHWPKNMILNPDTLQLNTVPVINLHQELAQPILCEGTQERFAVRPVDPGQRFELHSVVGVYKISETGLTPLRSGVLSGESGTYEIETEAGEQRRSWVRVNMPEAFDEPVKLSVDARWYQPWFSKRLSGLLEASLVDRHLPGIKWEVLGEVRGHVASTVENDPDVLLQLLAIRTKPFLSLDELKQILTALGTLSGYFRYLPELLVGLSRSQRKGPQGVVHSYTLELKEFEASYEPVVEKFAEQVFKILDAWSFDAGVELKVAAPGLSEPLTFTGWSTT